MDVEVDELAWLLWCKERVERARDRKLVAWQQEAESESRRGGRRRGTDQWGD
jgi:hypothetical protein